MNPQIIETDSSKTWLGEDGILRGIVKPGHEMTGADAEENLALTANLCGGCPCPILVDLRATKGFSREARVTYAGKSGSFSAVALLIHSSLSRILGSFLMGLNKPVIPLRLFTDEEEALVWLKGYL